MSGCVELAAGCPAAKRHHHQVHSLDYHLDVIPPRRDPVADLAEAVGKALLEFAERLRAEPEPTVAPAPAEPGAPNRAKLGATQAKILEALAAASPGGLTASEVAEKVGASSTNAPRALKALQGRGLVTDSEDTPTIWRAVIADA